MGAVYRVSPGILDVVVAGSNVVLLAPDTMDVSAASKHVVEGHARLRCLFRSVVQAAGSQKSHVQKKRDLGAFYEES